MMVLAVVLHNIPEGMAVGVVYAGWNAGNSGITLTGALALSIGIAIQNLPEGAIISMPLHAEGMSKRKAFIYGVFVWPCGTDRRDITILAAGVIIPDTTIFIEFRGRSHDICCRGRTDSGNVCWRTFQHRNDYVCGRFYGDVMLDVALG